jgi:hypothetical protein
LVAIVTLESVVAWFRLLRNPGTPEYEPVEDVIPPINVLD